MPPLMQLPAYRTDNALLNFSGLNEGIDSYRQGKADVRNALIQDEKLGMQRESHASTMDSARMDREKQAASLYAGPAQMILSQKDQNIASQSWGRIVSANPEMTKRLQQYGIDPRDHRAGAEFFVAQARGYRDPLDEQAKRAQIASSGAATAASVGGESRANALHPYAILKADADLNQPQQNFQVIPEGASLVRENKRTGEAKVVLQGQQKQDATAKKAIDEADDFVQQNQSAIGSLQQAIALNNKAYSGALANTRSGIVNNVPFLGGTQGSRATRDLDNLVTNQALQSLRSVFGGNPTEGERKILLDVAGSVNEIPAVRKTIFDRALQAANTRLQFNTQKAHGIRSGTYYAPGGQPAAITPNTQSQLQQAAPAEASMPQIRGDTDYDSLPSGTRFVGPDGKTRVKP